jgi:hypothetical protein
MRELNPTELAYVSGGLDNLSIFALSTLGGALLGGGIGTVIALNMAVPTISLFPIWVAACTAAGGAVGTLTGFTFALGGILNLFDQVA